MKKVLANPEPSTHGPKRHGEERLPVHLLDGEAVSCDDTGLAVFERIRHRRNDANVFLYAFDMLSLDGRDLRRDPIEERKAALAVN